MPSEPRARIRPAGVADFDHIAALTNEYIRGTAIHFSYQEVAATELETDWRAKRDRYPWFVAEIEGKFAGYAKAGPWRDRAAYQWTPELGVYVEPRFHRRGVGRALYSRIIEELRAAGFHTLIGGITLPNDASVRLHESMGFEKVAHFRDAGHKLGRWHDVGFWQLRLRDGTHTPEPIQKRT